MSPRDEAQALLPAKLQPPPLRSALATLISTFCLVCIAVSFNLSAVTLLLSFSLVVFYSALWTGEGSAYERGYPSTRLFIAVLIGSAVAGLFAGIKIYVHIYTPYYLASSGRLYENVDPFAHSAEYEDAGVIHFSSDAAVDTSRSFGYKASDYTYCVAPVVSRSQPVHPDSAGPKISFWAVGKDCCGSRREFDCDGAGDNDANKALRIKDLDQDILTSLVAPNQISSSQPLYMKAIQAARALHNLNVDDENHIIFLRWASDPDDTLQVWLSRTWLAVASACVLYSALISAMWVLIHSYYDKDVCKNMKDSGLLMPAKSGILP